jgi:ribosomal protein S18 acetylase RimI-like enzyme
MTLKPAKPNNLIELQDICKASYVQNFADHWTGNGLELYLEQEFGTTRLSSDLKDPKIGYYFILNNKDTVGFIKMNYQSSNTLSPLDNCELDKIYILPKYSGMGLGKLAMTDIIQQIQKKGKKLFFLCVIDTNKNSIGFYETLGFKFHSKTSLDIPQFREELKGMIRMQLFLE